MAKTLGHAIVVENKPGAGSVIGTQAVVQSNDGHTLLMGSTSMTILPALRSDLPYDPVKDLQPVGMVSRQPLVLSVAADSPLKTLEGVIARGRAGSELTAGNSGNGSLSHLTTELFNIRMGTHLLPVPYKGESALMPDIVGGTTAMAFLNLPSALPLLKAGRLRALALTSPERSPLMPEVPGMIEAGFPDYSIAFWYGLFVPAGTPPEIIRKLYDATIAASQRPEVKATLAREGTEVAVSKSPEEFAAFLAQDAKLWVRLAKESGAKAE